MIPEVEKHLSAEDKDLNELEDLIKSLENECLSLEKEVDFGKKDIEAQSQLQKDLESKLNSTECSLMEMRNSLYS